MEKTWDFFLDRCGLAYSDQQRYLDDMVTGDADASGNSAGTEDGKILWAGTAGEVLHDTYRVSVVGNRRVQNCYVMGMFDGSPITTDQMNAEFLQIMARSPGVEFSGGVTPEVSGFSGIDADTYRYGVLGALPDDIVARVIIGLWVVEIFSSHVDAVE